MFYMLVRPKQQHPLEEEEEEEEGRWTLDVDINTIAG